MAENVEPSQAGGGTHDQDIGQEDLTGVYGFEVELIAELLREQRAATTTTDRKKL